MKRRSPQFKFVILALVILAPIVFVLFWQAKDKAAVRKYRAKLSAAGEPLTLNQVLAKTVRPESNGTFMAQQALRLFRSSGSSLLDTNEPRAMRMVAPGKAMLGWNQSAVRDQVTNSWEEVFAALAQQCPPPEWIDQIIETPVLDFQLDYGLGADMLLPHLAPLKYSTRLLSIGTVCDLHRGDPDEAVTKIRAILATAQAMRDEPLIISQLVRIAITHIGVAATWELLQFPDLTESQLASLQADWARLNFLQPCESALLMERAIGQQVLERMRSSSSEFRRVASGWGTVPGTAPAGDWLETAGKFALEKTKEAAWTYAWSYPDELRSLKGHEVLLDSVRLLKSGHPYFETLQQEVEGLTKLGIEPRKDDEEKMLFDLGDLDVRNLMSGSILSLQRTLARVEAAEISRSLTVTAIALKRYQLLHGKPPPELAALVPGYVPSVPIDPVDGKPLRYRLNSDVNFVLYSIGADGIDNGGDPTNPESTPGAKSSFSWQRGRDWVWPQPATDAEIDAYFQKQYPQSKAAYGQGVLRK